MLKELIPLKRYYTNANFHVSQSNRVIKKKSLLEGRWYTIKGFTKRKNKLTLKYENGIYYGVVSSVVTLCSS